MLKNIFSKQTKKSLSIYLGMHKVAICEDGDEPILIAGEFINSELDWATAIKKIVQEHQLQGTHAAVVLSKDFYQTFDLDKPKLEEKELLATLPFSIKDLVSESVFDLIVDYVDKPAQVRKGEQITVICTAKSRITDIRDMLSENELVLNKVTTEEMAVCQLLESDNEANMLLYQQANELVLTVVQQGQLYLTLRIRGYNELLPHPLEDMEAALVEGLSLEIQRALDYINAQLGVHAVGHLFLALQCPDIGALSSKLSVYLDKKVTPFPEQFNYHFLLAYGGFKKEASK